MKPRFLLALAAALLFPLLAACGSNASSPEPATGETLGAVPSGGVELAGTSWVLEEASLGAPIPEDPPITLEFSDSEAFGNSGVNTFRGEYQAAASGELTFGPLASTKMAGEPDAMAFEGEFLMALQSTFGYTSDGRTLTLYGAADQVLTFVAA